MPRADWSYGTEGAAFPVAVGDVWQAVAGNGSRHIFTCSDVMGSDLLDRAVAEMPPTLLYSDPPWNNGHINAFRTKAGLGKATYSIWDFYVRVLSFAPAGGPAWVEGGNREAPKIADLMRERFTSTGQVSMVYYRKHPMAVHYGGWKAPSGAFLAELNGKDDDYGPELVMRHTAPTGVVIDPCAGRGLTSRTAASLGWSSVTNEMHPRRMSAALDRLVKKLGGDVEVSKR